MPRVLVPADLVVLAAGVSAAMHIGKLPPALPALREAFGMSLVEAGFLLSIVQVAGMCAGIVVGLVADSLGARRTILCGLATLAVASMVGGFAHEVWQLMALRAAEGFGFLVAILPVPRLLRSLVPHGELALKLGLWGAFMPTGTAIALLLGPWVIALAGWQGWWWLLAAVTAAMTFWIAAAVDDDAHRPADAHPEEREWQQRLRTTLASPGPWLVALTFAMYSNQWMSIIGFLPTIYAQAGLSVAAAGALTALVAAVNAIGNIAAGRLLYRGVRPEHVLSAGFATMTACAILAFGVPAPLWLRFAAVLVLSGVGGLIPGALFPIAVELAPSPRTLSTTVGWMQQFSAAGQFAGPPLVALVASAIGGWQLTWTVTGGASVIGIALAWLIGRVHRSRTQAAKAVTPIASPPAKP
ncbi:MAG: MFS transporter [Burkholderiales bacterium]|nr:MFS transporter [Burkholderiales bacterium]